MSAPASKPSVLTVLDTEARARRRNANSERSGGNAQRAQMFDERAENIEAARAAVAELVEALRITSAALESQLNDPNASLADGFAAANVARAALARIGGAS